MVEFKGELLPVLEQLEREKRIKKEEIINLVERALIASYKKHIGKDANVEAKIDPSTAEIKAFVVKKVVDVVSDANCEITLDMAKEINPEAELGSRVRIPLETHEFSRIAAQAAKQVIIQKIRASERINLYEEFKSKEGTVMTGVVYRFVNKNIIIDLGKVEAILPVREQSPAEKLRIGESIKVLILNVEKGPREPRVLVSRVHTDLIKKLFELEVPEIYEKIVEIVDVKYIPGVRAKVVVISHNPRVDAVGACVGIKGGRIKPIIEELRNIKIDLVSYSDDPEKYIINALSPAKVSAVKVIDAEKKIAEVTVPDEMFAIAIGKNGQNVLLASKLTGWEIELKTESGKTAREKVVLGIEEIIHLLGIGKKTAKILFDKGFNNIQKLSTTTIEEFTALQGIGTKTAKKIITAIKKIRSDKSRIVTDSQHAEMKA